MSGPLPRSSPEAEGVDSAAIEAFVRAASREDLGLHSAMVLRHGRVVAETWWAPYERETRHTMFSVSKSFTATAIGVAVDDALLSLDEPVLDFFDASATPVARANMDGVRVRDLLTMSAGHGDDSLAVLRALPHEDWARLVMEIPLVFPPGSHFVYDSGCSYLLSALLLRRSGRTALELLRDRLFGPLGIDAESWASDERGVPFGWTGLALTTEELAKFGQLYLQGGVWEGRRLLSEEWVRSATSLQVATGTDPDDDWAQGYGFQFWRSTHDSYRADGAFGQFCFVLPAEQVVVAITAGADRPRQVPGLIWDELLPGVRSAPVGATAGTSVGTALRPRARLPLPSYVDPAPAALAALDCRRVRLSFNTLGFASVQVSTGASSVRFRFETVDGTEELIEAGTRDWSLGRSSMFRYEEFDGGAVASTAGWTDASTLQLRQQFLETPFARVWDFEPVDARACRVCVRLDPGPWIGRVEELTGEIE